MYLKGESERLKFQWTRTSIAKLYLDLAFEMLSTFLENLDFRNDT